MYIVDDETDKSLSSVTVLLNKTELQELIGYAEQLLENPSSQHHHISSVDYQKEITICFFDPEKIDEFSPNIQKIIRDKE